nr:serine/arginine repetitive matrix protein 2-like [Ipomoea batatas]
MSDDSHNLSAQDYDDQYDDEISESRGFSPGHSDDVQVVHARPVGGKPAKARPTVPIRSISSKAPLKKEKVHKGEGTSSGPKGKSVSKPNTTGGNDVELDTDGAHDTLIEMSVKEEEQSLKVAIKRKSTTAADQHNVDRPPIESCPSSSSVAQDQTKSTGKRPMEVTKVEPPADVHAADPKRSRLAGETPRLADALARDAFSLPEMFNLLFQMSPPPASLVNEATDVVAGQVAHHLSQVASGTVELFVRAMVNVSHRDQEIRELKEKVRHLEAQVDTLNRYPDSDQFFQDAAALYPFRPANLPALVKSFCSSEGAATPLLQALHQDPIGLQVLRRVTAWGYHRGKYVMQESLHRALADGLEDWEQVRALLPEQIPPPGPEPFSDPLVGPTDLNTTNSQSHVP